MLRLDKQINDAEKAQFAREANGHTISQVVRELLTAYDPDVIETEKTKVKKESPNASPAEIEREAGLWHQQMIEKAVAVFDNNHLRDYIVNVRKKYDQIIDGINIDEITNRGWVKDREGEAALTIDHFTKWIEAHKDEIMALQIFYAQPYRRRELTYSMIKELCEKLKEEQPLLSPLSVWSAYEKMGKTKASPKNELTALVSLLRTVSGIDASLTPYDKTVDKNFQEWVFQKQAGAVKFTAEQMQWLRMIKDYVAQSFHVDREDFELDPFNKAGGLGKFYQMFGADYEKILAELNEVLAA